MMAGMRVVLTGGTGVIGHAAVPALVAAGHEVVLAVRKDSSHGADLPGTRRVADLFDVDSLVEAFEGADAAINLATRIPVGYAAVRPGAWRRNDELRTFGAANVASAATRAGVRRVIQESVSFVYADAGDHWISEDDPVDITVATEPVAVAEASAQEYAGPGRAGVVLRFGMIVGAEPQTMFTLRGVGHGRPIGLGDPDGWAHLVHTDDLGTAILAALQAPTGVYNVGATPVRKREATAAFAQVAGVDRASFIGPVLQRLAGARLEPLARSLRVSSRRFSTATGWRPSRPVFGVEWLEGAMELQASNE